MHLEGLAAENVITIDTSVTDYEHGFGPSPDAPAAVVALVQRTGAVVDVDAMRAELEAARG
jgi:hypothetical protein